MSLAVVLAAAVVLSLLSGLTDPDARAHGGRTALEAPLTATVTVAPAAPLARVPDSFLGLSTEYWTVPIWARQAALLARVLGLLHVRGQAPLVLRIGGSSADHSFWEPRARETPDWAFALTPSWLAGLRALVQQARLRLILDVNLVTATPALAAAWAGAAEAGMPRGSIIAFEVGNEPDLYTRAGWLAMLGGPEDAGALLPRAITAAGYVTDFARYAAALRRVAPGVPLMGPALANPHLDIAWIAELLRSPHPGLAAITAHRYTYSACALPGTRAFPTVARILSEVASAGAAQALSPDIALAHRAGLPFRLTELNSVTCGGLPGVSDRFATALWAPDALFELLRAGADAVDVHVRAHAVNAAFVLTGAGVVARPLLYGLIVFARTLGPHAELVAARVSAPPLAHLKAWAVRTGARTLHVLLINKGTRPLRVRLRLPAAGPAYLERLLAPSPSARDGVTLGGQWLNASGRWTGPRTVWVLHRSGGGYALALPRASAALVSVQLPARGAGNHRGRGRQAEPPGRGAPPRGRRRL